MESNCVFCNKNQSDYLFENESMVAFYDTFPVNKGHILIVPKVHIDSIFRLTPREWRHLQYMLLNVEGYLSGSKYGARGFNVGFNDGPIAGQTITHAHVHVIPRYKGDVADPQGGIRNIKEAIVKYEPER
jgi:diadenosine tetraphosphate (Ap4A) HIT family hydrolase